MQKEFLEAGQIVNTHGVRGEVKVQSWCDSPEVLTDFETMYFEDGTSVDIEKAYVHKNCVIMTLSGIDTMEKAQMLKQKVLYLKREDIDLPEDLVFVQDIIGFEVFDTRIDGVVGKLQDVLTSNPSYDLYEIKTEAGKLVYVPAIKPFLQSVELEQKRIIIQTIEGLIE